MDIKAWLHYTSSGRQPVSEIYTGIMN